MKVPRFQPYEVLPEFGTRSSRLRPILVKIPNFFTTIEVITDTIRLIEDFTAKNFIHRPDLLTELLILGSFYRGMAFVLGCQYFCPPRGCLDSCRQGANNKSP